MFFNASRMRRPRTRIRQLARRHTVLIATALLIVSCTGEHAFAFLEDDATWEGDPVECTACHSEDLPFSTRSGPHEGYTTTSRKCAICHSVHNAPVGGVKLLAKQTMTENCMVCHDGSGGNGVYGAIAARGLAVGSTHRVDVTSTIPGGSALNGADRSATFSGVNETLSCGDCHSPHGADVVDPFSGERVRWHETDENWLTDWSSSKLLRRKPIGSDRSVLEYGSDWCAGCHQGRESGLPSVMNHSVDTSATNADPFTYDNVAIVISDVSSETTLGTLGRLGGLPGAEWHNRGYVMPSPRTADQTGHAPICQQCHEDSRSVGEVGAVEPAHVYRFGDGLTDGDAGTDNPLFQSFPHETQNVKMLVETGDNLCLNCHSQADLP